MGDTLRLTGAGSAMALHSSAPALLRALRTRCPGDAAPNLNQARVTYRGQVSEWMRHSTLYIRRTRRWRWAKSRYLWKARARRSPAPA